MPHEPVIIQGKKDDGSIQFVVKGDCKITVKNSKGKEVFIKKLVEGHHFGEIGMIWDCERTATVYSMNYNTFAWMSRENYRRFIQDYPEFETCIKNHLVQNCDDHRIEFLQNMVKRVEYLDQVPIDILFDLIFSLQ